MDSFLRKVLAISIVIVGIACMSALQAQTKDVLPDKAPEFTIYQYKDKTFSTDSIYGKKILTLVFGSIT